MVVAAVIVAPMKVRLLKRMMQKKREDVDEE